jgi:hypothetical protein
MKVQEIITAQPEEDTETIKGHLKDDEKPEEAELAVDRPDEYDIRISFGNF